MLPEVSPWRMGALPNLVSLPRLMASRMGCLTRLFSGFLLSGPGLLLGMLVSLLFRGEYFYLPYLVFCLVLAAVGFGGGGVLAPQVNETRFWPILLRLALAACLAALFALGVLAILNLTPLCVGQDNGDGTNDLLMCIVQTGLVTVVFGPLVVGLLAFAALLDSLFLVGLNRRQQTLSKGA